MPRNSPPSSSPSVLMHVTISGLAFLVLAMLAALQFDTFATLTGRATTEQEEEATPIGMEFTGSLKLDVTIARKGNAGYATFDVRTPTPVRLSLPQSWKRTEVRHASLTDVTMEEPALGFTRYALPAGAGITMEIPVVPSSLEFLSPSASVGSIHLHTIDLFSRAHIEHVLLVKDATEVLLWKEDF